MIEVTTTNSTYFLNDREVCDFICACQRDGRLIEIRKLSHNDVTEHFNRFDEQIESSICTDAVLRVCSGDIDHKEVNWGRDGF